MKHIVRIAFLLAFLPSITFAQSSWGDPDGDQQLKESDLKGPKVTLKQDSFDLGQIKQNIPVQVTYEITNTGNAPLIISNVKPACDCTAADWPKAPIMPGKTAKIVVEYDAKSAGKFSKAAVVTTNAQPTEFTLVFTGTVIQ